MLGIEETAKASGLVFEVSLVGPSVDVCVNLRLGVRAYGDY